MTLQEYISIELKPDGYSNRDILNFLSDGHALSELAKKIDFTQSDVEKATNDTEEDIRVGFMASFHLG